MKMGNNVNSEKLHPEVRKKFVPYLERMRDIHGDNLISAFIYGSAAGKNYVPKVSDINSAFIFGALSFQAFKNSLAICSKGISKKIAAPLFLTKNYIESSLDVFPVEFLDMKESHVLLCGEDILSGLEIKGSHIRLFCEQQIKGKLIRIRQAYLEVGHNKKGLEALLKESLNSLMPIFRNLVRLKGQKPLADKADVLKQLCEAFELDEGVFLAIYRDSSNDEKIANQEVVVFLERYLTEIEKLAGMVDRL